MQDCSVYLLQPRHEAVQDVTAKKFEKVEAAKQMIREDDRDNNDKSLSSEDLNIIMQIFDQPSIQNDNIKQNPGKKGLKKVKKH